VKSHLVLQTSFLGDAILTLPMLSELARLDPSARIVCIVTPVTKPLIDLALQRGLKNFSDRIFCIEFPKKNPALKTPWGLRRWVRSQNFILGDVDSAFCVQRSLRTAFIAWLAKAKTRIGFSSGSSAFLYDVVVPRDWSSGKSEIEKNLDLLRARFLDSEIPSWVFNQSAPSLLKPSVEVQQPNKIVLAMGSPWPTKDWPYENCLGFIERAISSGAEVVLTGDGSAITRAQKLEQSVPRHRLRNLVGQTSIREWVDEIATSQVVVSGDSATVHLASDLGVPVLALFGPTVPDFGFAPWRKPSLVLGIKDLPCRPCDIHGPKTCPKGHHKCMVDLAPDKVWSFSLDFLEGRRAE
jgi:heptosyltransferase-2